MFNIEKNITLPTEAKESESRFPFDDMEIGDSFVASNEPLAFIEIVEEMEKRNEAGDGRLFISWATMRDPVLSTLRIWRVSFADYIDKKAPDDAPVIECMLNLLNNGPMSYSALTRTNLAITHGSLADRLRILKKYAFLFKTSRGETSGIKYEIA